ncbi:MAG: RES domain-containing protein [Nitrososphaerota archaeon]|nr:RES domain-containing protein [Nitrososphaerota archaeon]
MKQRIVVEAPSVTVRHLSEEKLGQIISTRTSKVARTHQRCYTSDNEDDEEGTTLQEGQPLETWEGFDPREFHPYQMRLNAGPQKYVGDKTVCHRCFTDTSISAFIRRNATSLKCDYCSSDDCKAAKMSHVMVFMLKGLNAGFAHPEQGRAPKRVGHYFEDVDIGEIEYPIVSTFDSRFLFEEMISPFTNNQSVFEDILDFFGGRLWCQRKSSDEGTTLAIGWAMFVAQVMHLSRYTFLRTRQKRKRLSYDDTITSRMLDVVTSIINDVDRVRPIVNVMKKNRYVYRARVHATGETCNDEDTLGPPTHRQAKNSRMSPSGITVFYGALDESTALSETIYPPSDAEKSVTVGKWQVVRDLRVLDLTRLPEVPSVFNLRRRALREKIEFLHWFAGAISLPAKPDDREHLEYVPTQVFTEYVRHLFIDRFGKTVRGIMYKSSKLQGGICCTLFLSHELEPDEKLTLSRYLHSKQSTAYRPEISNQYLRLVGRTNYNLCFEQTKARVG